MTATRWLLGIAAFVGLAASGPAGAEPPLVFAAASLADALTELGRAFEQDGGSKVAFSFGPSSDLARQIEMGAPAHLFVSADRAQVDRVLAAGKARPEEAFPLLGNTLVVVTPIAAEARQLGSAHDLLAFDRLALPDPEAVPLGVYARRWLEAEGLWQSLSGRVVPTLDARATLAAVAAGNLPAGIVYATDAASSAKVQVVYRVPAEKGPEIRYWVVRISGPAPAGLDAFMRRLQSPAAGEIFRRHGFQFLPGG